MNNKAQVASDASAPRVDFYVCTKASGSREVVACRLTEKAVHMGHRVFMQMNNAKQSEVMDTLLWTFAGGSFVPHRKIGDDEANDDRGGQNTDAEKSSDAVSDLLKRHTPVLLSHLPPPSLANDVLINMHDDASPHCQQFKRIAEVVGGDEKDKVRARECYKYYVSQGLEVTTHQLPG